MSLGIGAVSDLLFVFEVVNEGVLFILLNDLQLLFFDLRELLSLLPDNVLE